MKRSTRVANWLDAHVFIINVVLIMAFVVIVALTIWAKAVCPDVGPCK